MSVEAKRGCGYRKAGGIYMVSGDPGEPCERLPFPLVSCPTCGAGVKQSRGYTWLAAAHATAGARACMFNPAHCPRCVVCQPVVLQRCGEPADRFGLRWVGAQHYPSPLDWYKEARALGVSMRVAAVPKDFVPGKTFVLIAHPRAILRPCGTCGAKLDPHPDGACPACKAAKGSAWVPGVFHCTCPTIEVVVTPAMRKQAWVAQLVKRHGAALVEVPEDDPDHAPAERERSARKKAMDKAARKAAKAVPLA